MMIGRLSVLIPLLLILSSLMVSALLFWRDISVASTTIRQTGINNLHTTLTQLQNMLNTQLAADSLEDAKLSLSVSALNPGIHTLLLTDENNVVILANHYIWEGNPAAKVSGYNDQIANQVLQNLTSSVSFDADILNGYYPVTLKIVPGGMGANRIGVLFVEYDFAPQLAQARYNAVVQASLVGGLTIAVAIAVALLLHWLVTLRVQKIVEISKLFAAGDLDVRVNLSGRDELAELGLAFDSMAQQRKKAQDEVIELSLRNRLILEATGEGIYGVGLDGLCTFANPAAAQLLGFKVDELLGQHSHEQFHHTRKNGRPYPEEECPIEAVYKQGVAHRGNDFFWRKDDGGFPVELVCTPILEAGQVTGAVVVFRDITERKKAEKSLTEYAAIIESSDDAIVGKTLDGVITSWNKGAERMLGYRSDEIVGLSIDMLVPVDRHRDERQILEKIRRGESIKHYETKRRCKDGRLIDVAVTVSPLKNSEGEIIGASKIARDITEQKRAEEELQRYREQLEVTVQQRTAELLLARNEAEAANKAKSVFLANMSHELRTPMNAVLGFSNMMLQDPQLSENQRANLDIIIRSGEHLLSLINDVLEVAKIEAGRVQLENAPLDLGVIVRDVTDMMQIRARNKGLHLLIDQDSRFPRYVTGDEARLRQVLINLIGNAIKFTQKGGVSLRLGTKQNKFSHLLIEVEDSGPGITQEDQQRIFDPFVQLGEQGDNKGSGLGLAITRQFVHMMGGRITLESRPDKGSLFKVDLPLNEVAEADIVKPNQLDKGEPVGLAPGQPEYRILIVEDQRDNQLLLTKLMESVGFQFKVAENGKQGIELFQSWQPHLILMDRRMPMMDGLEATRNIRELPGGKEVKIIAVTASAFAEQRDEMLDAGMDDFVRKPYRFDEIYDCLAKQLGIRFIYGETVEQQSEVMVLAPEMLLVLPETLRSELKEALDSLDNERIELIIQQVATYDVKLQKILAYLAENFDYPTILKALEANQE